MKHINTCSLNAKNIMITSDYHLCCSISSESLCLTADKPWYISCSDVLPKYSMKISFIFISVFIFVLNITSIFMYSLKQKSMKTFSAIVISININDLVCGIYLNCIWVSDIIFKDKFMVKEEIWRSGPGCFTALGITLWYTIQTQTVLIFLSFSRLVVVVHPIKTKFRRLCFVVKSIVLMYVVSFLTAFFSNCFYQSVE